MAFTRSFSKLLLASLVIIPITLHGAAPKAQKASLVLKPEILSRSIIVSTSYDLPGVLSFSQDPQQAKIIPVQRGRFLKITLDNNPNNPMIVPARLKLNTPYPVPGHGSSLTLH